METTITTSVRVAARHIQRGNLVAFPTETVYGLGADVFNRSAVNKIFRAKGRPSDNPLIVHISSTGELRKVADKIPRIAKELIRAFFPGPLTIILPKRHNIPGNVTGGLKTVAVRMPDHPTTQRFLRACGTPIAAPSANRSGKPSPTSWQAVVDDLDGRIHCILKGERSRVGLESTVVDCTTGRPVVLRTGAVSIERLRKVCPGIRIAARKRVGIPKSPGMKYRHYAPKAQVKVIDSPRREITSATAAYIGLTRPLAGFGSAKTCGSLRDYARFLYHFFRLCDQKGIKTIYCQRVPHRGLGIAIMDRVRRAAHR